MRRTELLQETRLMRFEEAYDGWTESRLTQEEEVARLLGLCERTFRRYIDHYEEAGLDGLIDKRLSQVSHRKAPADEVMALVDRYRDRQGKFVLSQNPPPLRISCHFQVVKHPSHIHDEVTHGLSNPL